MTRVKIVPATPEIMRKVFPTFRSVRAIAAVRGDEVLGVAGIYPDAARLVLWGYLTDELRRDKRTLLKAVKVLKTILPKQHIESLADPSIPGSDVLLRHVGFTHRGKGIWVH